MMRSGMVGKQGPVLAGESQGSCRLRQGPGWVTLDSSILVASLVWMVTVTWGNRLCSL